MHMLHFPYLARLAFWNSTHDDHGFPRHDGVRDYYFNHKHHYHHLDEEDERRISRLSRTSWLKNFDHYMHVVLPIAFVAYVVTMLLVWHKYH